LVQQNIFVIEAQNQQPAAELVVADCGDTDNGLEISDFVIILIGKFDLSQNGW
jgi:hypothetical protein